MGRKSKLSDAQWAEVERRLLENESGRALAEEFGISEAALREHFKRKEGSPEKVRDVAQKIVAAELALDALPPLARKSAQNLAQILRSTVENLATGAQLGSANCMRLQALANSELQKVDDADPLGAQSTPFLKNVATLTKMANDAFYVPGNLIAGNKDAVKQVLIDPPPGGSEDEELTPERRREGVRRLAFLLHQAGREPVEAP